MDTNTTEKLYLSWEEYGKAALELANEVVHDGYAPDIVVCLARGGMTLGSSMGYALDIKNVYVMNVEYYTSDNRTLDEPVFLPPYLDLSDLEDANILLVDDVADTGDTFEMVIDFCRGKVKEIRTLVLYEKPQSVVKCDYVWGHTDLWIEFPWSLHTPVPSMVTV